MVAITSAFPKAGVMASMLMLVLLVGGWKYMMTLTMWAIYGAGPCPSKSRYIKDLVHVPNFLGGGHVP